MVRRKSNDGLDTKDLSRESDGSIVLAEVNTIRAYFECEIRAIVQDEGNTKIGAHSLRDARPRYERPCIKVFVA